MTPFLGYKYTSKELDNSTGLYFYEARYYDAWLGRFVSADTIVPNPVDPQAFNRYAYVLNNPIRYNDPTGHVPGIPGIDITIGPPISPGWGGGWSYAPPPAFTPSFGGGYGARAGVFRLSRCFFSNWKSSGRWSIRNYFPSGYLPLQPSNKPEPGKT